MSEYASRRVKIERRFQRLLDELATLFAFVNQPAEVDLNLMRASKGAVLTAVEDIVDGMHTAFTATEVFNLVRARLPSVKRASVSCVLNRLADAGAIRVVQKGFGRRPFIYTKGNR